MSIKETAITTIEVTAKTVVGAIPFGSILVNVYDAIKGGCLDKRRKKWQATIEERLSHIEKTLDDIGNNENFATTIIRTTEMAMKTASEEKITYLANAVINSIDINIEEEKMILFLALLDKYTVSHIKTINFFNNPKKFGVDASNYYMGSPKDPLFQTCPELNTPIFDKIFKDLYLDGLVTSDSLNSTMTPNGMVAKRTSALGDEFLSFIINNSAKQ